VIQGGVEQLGELPTDGEENSYEAIIAVDGLGSASERDALASLCSAGAPSARLVVLQQVPRRSTRLSQVIESTCPGFGGNDSDRLLGVLRTAEESLYDDEANTMVNWDVPDLTESVRSAGWEIEQEEILLQEQSRRVAGELVTEWMDTARDRSLGRAVLELSDDATVDLLRSSLRSALQDNEVAWETRVSVIVAKLPRSGR
jgi:hypothetical protein